MEVIELEGEDKRLYDLVARLVMNPQVLRYNQNYPFRTSQEYRFLTAQVSQKRVDEDGCPSVQFLQWPFLECR